MRNFLFLLLIIPLLTNAQIVEEKIQIDTITETIKVIYKPIVKTSYYYKKIAVFAADTSQIAFEKSYNKLGQNGLYKVYYPSGRLKIKTVFANNKINGEWTYYDLEGVIITKGQYREGVKHGYWAYKSLRIYGRYKNGLKNRKWKRFSEKKKYTSHYRNGVLTIGEGYIGDEDAEGAPVKRSLFARIFPKKTKKTSKPELDVYQDNIISKEYQQAISFLENNTLFRRNAKSYFGGSVKKYFKKDKFHFVISSGIVALDISSFIIESKEGKIVVASIDSLLKNNSEQLSNSFSGENVGDIPELETKSTDMDSPLTVVFSKINFNLMRVDVTWNKEGEAKKFQILLYYNDDRILKGAEYQKP